MPEHFLLANDIYDSPRAAYQSIHSRHKLSPKAKDSEDLERIVPFPGEHRAHATVMSTVHCMKRNGKAISKALLRQLDYLTCSPRLVPSSLTALMISFAG